MNLASCKEATIDTKVLTNSENNWKTRKETVNRNKLYRIKEQFEAVNVSAYMHKNNSGYQLQYWYSELNNERSKAILLEKQLL